MVVVQILQCWVKLTPPVDELKVKILFEDAPKCEYEELAFITTRLRWNQNAAVEDARESAASIGSDYISIKNVKINAYNDASVSAIAYKCGNVDKENVEVRKK